MKHKISWEEEKRIMDEQLAKAKPKAKAKRKLKNKPKAKE